MNILALDLGTTFGYAYDGRVGGPTVGSCSLATKNEIRQWTEQKITRRLDPRILRFHQRLEALRVGNGHLETVVFEDVQFASFTYQTQLWASLRACVWLFAGQNGLRCECVPVKTLKKSATGLGYATKEQMSQQMPKDRFSCRPGNKVLDKFSGALLDDNAVDAWHLLTTAHLLYDRSTGTRTA